jgi:hypothetical protein
MTERKNGEIGYYVKMSDLSLRQVLRVRGLVVLCSIHCDDGRSLVEFYEVYDVKVHNVVGHYGFREYHSDDNETIVYGCCEGRGFLIDQDVIDENLLVY